MWRNQGEEAWGGQVAPLARQAMGAKQPHQNILCLMNRNVCVAKFDK